MNNRLKKWPYWTRTNTGLFIAGLAVIVLLYAALYQSQPRVAFMILIIVSAASVITLLWITINHKDKHETH